MVCGLPFCSVFIHSRLTRPHSLNIYLLGNEKEARLIGGDASESLRLPYMYMYAPCHELSVDLSYNHVLRPSRGHHDCTLIL